MIQSAPQPATPEAPGSAQPATIRIIDLCDDRPDNPEGVLRIAAAIRTACCDTGFFYVTGHGVSDEHIAALEAAARDFFALPDEAKTKVHYHNLGNHLGYEPTAAQTLAEGSPPDAKESFMFSRDLPDGHRFVIAGYPGEGRNQWPETLPPLKSAGEAYLAQITALGRKLARLVALSLGEQPDIFDDALADPAVSVRLLHYPADDAITSPEHMGAGAHTDWGFLTILRQDEVGGLEVRTRAGDWVQATPVPGSFIINLGDMMPQLTNGLYRSNFHRVRPSSRKRARYSIATFFNPDYAYEFDCLEACRSEGQVVERMSFGEHIHAMFERTYGASL